MYFFAYKLRKVTWENSVKNKTLDTKSIFNFVWIQQKTAIYVKLYNRVLILEGFWKEIQQSAILERISVWSNKEGAVKTRKLQSRVLWAEGC